ncbi:GAF domain-containing sensor histidine kinase [Sporichthya sp.]|uniref:GAF domain-containing sensor histidine kinase n=1 Tax=Sporichthya sp. TaxID=65475 RepID=UPI0025FAB669|nr:GAF domain-containing sensor histidine kinase [Sporichthya sp.]
MTDAAGLAARLGADAVVIFGGDGDDLFVADAAPGDPRLAEALRIPIGFGVTGRVASTGRPVRIDRDSPRNALHRQLIGLADGDPISRVCAPIPGLYGEIVGVLAGYRSVDRPFTEPELGTASELASSLGLRMHTEQLWLAVRRYRDDRDLLIAQAIEAQEGERRRIAFDLHDGVITVLASTAFHLNAAALAVSGPGDASAALAQIAEARHLADLAYHQTRAAVTGLHSLVLDDLGLVAALESLVRTVGPAGGTEVELLADPAQALGEIPDHAASALYRIAQEALGNAIQHSGASRILLSLQRVPGALVLACTDDGTGFDPVERKAARAADADPARQHFGLSSMEQRCALLGADLRLESAPGRGTRVIIEVPLAG